MDRLNGSGKGKAPAIAGDQRGLDVLHGNISQSLGISRSTGIVHPLNRKITILPFKNGKSKHESKSESIKLKWLKLETDTKVVLNGGQTDLCIEELYRLCEFLCHEWKYQTLYTNLQQLVEDYIKVELKQLLASLTYDTNNKSLDSLQQLSLISGYWKSYCKKLLMIRCIYLYLDRTYLLRSQQHKTIWDMGLQLFKEIIIENGKIKSIIVNGIFELVQFKRDDKPIDTLFLKSLIKMLMDLKLYFQLFDGSFVKNTKHYYANISKLRISEFKSKQNDLNIVSNYLKYVETILEKENQFYNQENIALDTITIKKINEVLIYVLIREHYNEIISYGFESFIDNKKYDDIKLMYNLLKQAGKVEQLKTAIQLYVEKIGLSIVIKYTRPEDLILSLLSFKSSLNYIINDVFDHDPNIVSGIKDGFETFLNKTSNKSAEMIARYIDIRLRTGKSSWDIQRKQTNDDLTILKYGKYEPKNLEAELEDCITLFKYLTAKDMFEAFYKKDLAKRLLQGRSSSFEHEKFMLKKLREECGPAFTSKLEGMFKDMDISKEYMASFKTSNVYKSVGITSTMAFEVNVLSSGFWPQWTTDGCILPKDFINCQKAFQKFYDSRHQGRKLTWINSNSKSVVKAYFPKGNKELFVTFFQTLILLLFNLPEPVRVVKESRKTRSHRGKRVSNRHNRDEDEEEEELEEIDENLEPIKLSFIEIQEKTGIPETDLLASLQSISTGKFDILKRDNKNNSMNVNKSDIFSINDSFEHPLTHIKVNSVLLKEKENEASKTKEQVFQDRQLAVDAAIVRIMKQNRKLTHQELLLNIQDYLKIEIPILDFKKRVDSLIERDYIERDEEDTNLYLYVL